VIGTSRRARPDDEFRHVAREAACEEIDEDVWRVAPHTGQSLVQFKLALTLIWPLTVGTAIWPPTGGRLDFAALDALADAIVSGDELGPASARPNR
jgi:hypothetical protein